MKPTCAVLALVLASSLAPASADERDCPISQRALEQFLLKRATDQIGAKANLEDLSATWADGNASTITLELSGCEHFGFEVRSKGPADSPASQDQILTRAARLTHAVLSPGDAANLRGAISRGEFDAEAHDSTRLYFFNLEGFQEFVVEYRFTTGLEEFTLSGGGY